MRRNWIALAAAAALLAVASHAGAQAAPDTKAAPDAKAAPDTKAAPTAKAAPDTKAAPDAKASTDAKAGTDAKPAAPAKPAATAKPAAPAKPAAAPDAAPTEPPSSGRAPAKKIGTPSGKKLISLNTATKEELKSLPGGSDEEAARIIAGRPYNSKAFLVTEKIVSEGRYTEIKGMVEAGALPKQPAPKK